MSHIFENVNKTQIYEPKGVAIKVLNHLAYEIVWCGIAVASIVMCFFREDIATRAIRKRDGNFLLETWDLIYIFITAYFLIDLIAHALVYRTTLLMKKR